MITAIHKALAAKREEREEGFTLIELLVVVLIIGILAAIAIPVFLGQQATAHDAAAKSDLANAEIAEISYETNNNGSLTTQASDLSDDGYTQTGGTKNFSITLGTTAGHFCITEESESNTPFQITQAGGVTTGSCSGYTN